MSYYQRHKIICLTKQNELNKLPKNKKKQRITNWKKNNFPTGDKTWDEIYDIYMNKTNCEMCNAKFPNDDTPINEPHKKNMTKDKGIICRECNHKTRVKNYKKKIY